MCHAFVAKSNNYLPFSNSFSRLIWKSIKGFPFSRHTKTFQIITNTIYKKNEKIIAENALTAKNPKNLKNKKTVYKFTAKGKRNMQKAKASIALSLNNDEHTSSGMSGGGEGGGPC